MILKCKKTIFSPFLKAFAREEPLPVTPHSSPALGRRSPPPRSPLTAAESPLPLCSPGMSSPPPLLPNPHETFTDGASADDNCPPDGVRHGGGTGAADDEAANRAACDQQLKGGDEEEEGRVPSPSSYSQSKETRV
jgi:hypothetical protein